jgi:hypothetical protein
VPARSVITGAAVPGQSGVTLLARVLGQNGVPITRASLSGIGWTLTDLTRGAVLGTGSLTINSAVFDSLQVGDPRWTIDTPVNPGADGANGYNFLAVLAATLFPIRPATPVDVLAGYQPKGVRYQADVVWTPVTGQPFRQIFSWLEGVVYG